MQLGRFFRKQEVAVAAIRQLTQSSIDLLYHAFFRIDGNALLVAHQNRCSPRRRSVAFLVLSSVEYSVLG